MRKVLLEREVTVPSVLAFFGPIPIQPTLVADVSGFWIRAQCPANTKGRLWNNCTTTSSRSNWRRATCSFSGSFLSTPVTTLCYFHLLHGSGLCSSYLLLIFWITSYLVRKTFVNGFSPCLWLSAIRINLFLSLSTLSDSSNKETAFEYSLWCKLSKAPLTLSKLSELSSNCTWFPLYCKLFSVFLTLRAKSRVVSVKFLSISDNVYQSSFSSEKQISIGNLIFRNPSMWSNLRFNIIQ